MKPSGRSPIPLSDRDIQAVKEYLESDKGYAEVALEFGMKKGQLQYKVKKYRKEQEEREKLNG